MKMVIKEIDRQGRIVIPYEWRREEGLETNTKVELTKDGEKILIKPMKYRSLMEVRDVTKKKMSIGKIEKAEAKASIKRFERAKN